MSLQTPVRRIMTTKLHTVQPQDPLTKVKALFDAYNIHHLPVVEGRKVVGIISKSDFLHFDHGFTIEYCDDPLYSRRLELQQAKDIMTKMVISVLPSVPISLAIEIFIANKFHALTVVKNGNLLGIITTHDIVKLAQQQLKVPEIWIW